MKKNLLALAVATAVTLTAGSAFASESKDSPLNFDGFVSVQFRENTATGAADKSNQIYKFVMNETFKDFAPHFDLYARTAGEYYTSTTTDSGRDFGNFPGQGTIANGPQVRSAFAPVDQFGLVYKNAGFNYKIGRQDVVIGSTALLYNNNFKVGKHVFADGVTMTGKSGVTSLKFQALQEENYGKNDNRVYALSASYSPAKNWTVGGILAKYDVIAGTDTNHWAVNFGYDIAKTSFFGEYTKSNANTNNTAYDFGVAYSFDKKNSGYVIYHKTEVNGDIGGNTDFDNGEKGMYYGFSHKFDKNATVSLFYKDNESIANGAQKNTSFRTTVTYAF